MVLNDSRQSLRILEMTNNSEKRDKGLERHISIEFSWMKFDHLVPLNEVTFILKSILRCLASSFVLKWNRGEFLNHHIDLQN